MWTIQGYKQKLIQEYNLVIKDSNYLVESFEDGKEVSSERYWELFRENQSISILLGFFIRDYPETNFEKEIRNLSEKNGELCLARKCYENRNF